MSESRKSQHISQILNVESYHNEIVAFNEMFVDVITFFRAFLQREGGNYSLIELGRQYLGAMSSMVWRLSVLTFEVGQSQAPELIVFKQNVVTLLNNINKLETKIRELVRAEKTWKQYYKGSAALDTKGRPIPTKSEIYWTTIIKSGLDKIYYDTNNLLHTAISLGAIYKVRLSVIDDMRNQPAPYQPKFVSPTEADEKRQQTIQKAVGKGVIE